MNVENRTATATWYCIQETILEIEQYYIPVFMCLSLLGNSLSVYVIFRSKLRYFSSSIYLSALAISDTGVLVTIIISWLITHVTKQENWATVFRICIENFFAFLSVWLVVTFTVERYVAIKWPLLHRSFCTIARAKIVVIVLTGIAALFTIPWFEFFFSIDIHTLYKDDTKMTYKDDNTTSDSYSEDKNNMRSDSMLRIMDMSIMFALPLIMIVIFNTLIVCNIYKQNHVQKDLSIASVTSSEQIQIASNETQIRITKMLILISSTFICLNTPVYICWFITDYHITNRPIWLDVAWNLSDLLWMTNYGINFVFYYLSGHNFRKALIRLFTKC
ncbi:thyrotropin-releasing hormone receptor-like [Linepithema humile]|uniref:thyrotropin-releasing hormone receptor-like n=1 Tax=Linepithema humile TaxID=83485 RepID=UPI0006233C74|nr:PREDICTED: thyrotropin-releasing hormone receptor-like [Linepithema humile]